LFYYYGDYSTIYFLSREREGQRKEGRGALASPLKQILVISALVIYKILEETLLL
jgi:hypothetical protein